MLADSVQIDETELPYLDTGDGQPVVFVHGGISDHRIWDAHCPTITPQYRLIALTQRYFGSSTWRDDGQRFSIQTHADDLAAFIGTLRLGPTAVVGWSYGGAVSLTMTVQHPQLVERLFLYEPSLATFFSDPAADDDRSQMIDVARMATKSGDIDGAVRLLMDAVNGGGGDFERLPAGVQAMMLENGRILPLLFAAPPPPPITCGALGRLGMPIVIAVGDDSREFYRLAAEAAHRCIPGSSLIRVPKARHLWPIQEPLAFSKMVLDFLDNG